MSTDGQNTNTTTIKLNGSFGPTKLERASELLATQQAKDALLKKSGFAKAICRAQDIFVEEWNATDGNIREAAYSLLLGQKVFGEYKGQRLKSHPKGKCTPDCGPHHRQEGYVFVDDGEGSYMLRLVHHGEALPEVPTYLAGAYIKDGGTHVHMRDAGTWRPKMQVIFDQLFFELPLSKADAEAGYEPFKIQAWDLVQGEDLDVLIKQGPEAYELLKFERAIEQAKAEKDKAEAKAAEAEAEAKAAEAEAKARKELEAKAEARKKAAAKLLKAMHREVYAMKNLVANISTSVKADTEKAMSLSREERRWLIRPPAYQDSLTTYSQENYNEETNIKDMLVLHLDSYLPEGVKSGLNLNDLVVSELKSID